jgi:CheY-like chemotaxis protein
MEGDSRDSTHPRSGTTAPVPQGHGQRILIVEDEELLAKLGRRVLERQGYLVDVETGAQQALETLRAGLVSYALVLTDQHLSGMLGTELAVELRAFNPGLPVVLTSGNHGDLAGEQVRAAGIRVVLPKPFTADGLGRAVHEALNSPTPR